MTTTKLYYEDPYVRQFKAKVISVSGTDVVLDATAFYPSGGGQVCDKGKIAGYDVVNVRKVDDGIVHELVSQPSFMAGQEVECSLDWEKRYRTMKLHSAAHIVYYLMKEVLGAEPASSGLVDDQKDRNDYLFESGLDREKLKLVDEGTNSVIDGGYAIKVWQEGDVRYWKIDPYPEMKCAGTHVRNTREIGPVQVTRGKKPGRGKERIETVLLSP